MILFSVLEKVKGCCLIIFQRQMIKLNTYAHHGCSQGIKASKNTPSYKRANKLSIQTINTVRANENKIDSLRLNTEPHKIQLAVPFQDDWEEIYNRRENFLNSMFNRRKTVLENISKKNKDIYIRITNQESHYHYSKSKQDKEEKQKNTIQNLTANSRLMLTLSKNALCQSNSHANKLEPLKEKQVNLKGNEAENKIEAKLLSRQLTPIIERGQAASQTTNFKIVESRYIKDELSFNASNKLIRMGQARGKSVGRARLADVYTNF